MNTALRLVERDESPLAQLEAKANQHKKNALREWQLFADTVMDIYKNHDWQAVNPDWNAYCKATFGVGASRIRQYAAAIPYAEIISSATGFEPTEHQIRVLKEVVKDETMLIPVYREAASLYDGQPARRHFVASWGVFQQSQKTGAVSVGGFATPVTDKTTKAAIQEACEEADKRFWEHRKGSNATAIKIILKRVGNRWQVEADGDLPDFVELTYWRKDNAQS